MKTSTSLLIFAAVQLVLPSAGFHVGTTLPAVRRHLASLSQSRGRRMQLRTPMMALDQGKVAKFLAKGEEAQNSEPKKLAKQPLCRAMNKPSKAIAVALEVSNKMPLDPIDALNEEYAVKGIKGFSKACRANNLNAIWVRKEKDGSDLDTLQAFCDEQQEAKGDFPGPVSVVRDGVCTMQDVAEAAAAGCTAVSISIPPLSPTAAQELVLGARGMGMESVVTVSSDLIEMAIEMGANAICVEVDGEADVQAMSAAIKNIPKGIAPLAKVKTDPFDMEKISLGRQLKDAGWLGIIFSGALNGSVEDLEAVPFTIAEATSKKSSQVNLNFTGTNRGGAAGASAPPRVPPSASSGSDSSSMPPPSAAPAPRPRPASKGTPVGQDMFGLDEFL